MKYIPSYNIEAHKKENDKQTRTPWIVLDGTFNYLREKYTFNKCKKVLDIGCDNGDLLKNFTSKDFELYGVDLYDYVDRDFREKVNFSSVDLNFEKLPYANDEFDVIFSLQVIEHLENPFQIMREVKRVLKNSGIFILSYPNPFTLSSRFRFLLFGNVSRWGKQNDHLLFLTNDVFDKTYLNEFELIETRYQKGTMPFIGKIFGILGIKFDKQKLKILPRNILFAKSVCFVLRPRFNPKSFDTSKQ